MRPIFARHCAGCHNRKAQMAGLDLTTAEGFQRGGESGPLVNREVPEESRLLKVIGYDDKLKMPPTGKLTADELTVLATWVKAGAHWAPAKNEALASNEAKPAGEAKPVGGAKPVFTEQERQFWAFQPMARPVVPELKDRAWVKSPVDAFILQRLEEKGLRPAPPADRLTLLRRATYDLTGLPPTEREIREFLDDAAPNAFEKVVERLLASPRYGEKWGRFWLDVARYADSTGNDEDHRYPYAWKYRDYVIEAFNRDLPYDRFVREQLAGDLLAPAKSPGVDRQAVVATGFLALGPKALAQQDKTRMLYDVYDEQLDVTSRAFLGLTVSCARCHNHKFDPILTRDYYSMVGIFASTRSFSNPRAFVSQVLYAPLVPKAEYDAYLARKKVHEEQVKRLELEIGEISDGAKGRLIAEQGPRLAEYLVAARRVSDGQTPVKAVAAERNLPEDLLQRWVDYLKPDKVRQHLLEWQNARPEDQEAVARRYQQRFLDRYAKWRTLIEEWRVKYRKALSEKADLPSRPEFEAGADRFFHEVYFGKRAPFAIGPDDQSRFTAEEWPRRTALGKELESLKKQEPPEPEMACAVEDGEIVDQKVFVRGDYHNEGEPAPKSFPLILAGRTPSPVIEKGSGRLQLAEWITQPEHPLTARVMANRVWQWHFGEGLVRTPDNFGKMGERPTHPELLDLLARRFVESGWSVKALHRLIMLSNAYQMSSQIQEPSLAADPENRLFSRFNRRRLTVEEMRDGMLALDGSLDLTMGGTLQTGTGTDGENDDKRLSLNPEKLTRRTVYLPLRRANLPGLLNLFDFGDATTPSGKRQLTNVATQALFWMNSEFLTERSRRLAQSLLDRKEWDDPQRVKAAYLRIVNREADPQEVAQAVAYLAAFSRRHAPEPSPLAAWQSFCRALLASNDFVYLD
ncbi:MAG TPA: PSD1 and planctomycete cytochrome C domain-containing protein [Blastocatellia bacterium]|nr:PSD1 and planctomycete cytochrome C domain-containing protein [Blastocatellia bacterium]